MIEKNTLVVVLTVYLNDNLDEFKQALDSLYSQTYKSFDIYVQEDGEVTDEIHSYLENEFKCKRINFLGMRKINKGFDYSLNELINRAMKNGYQYILRMDADDICYPERIQKQFDFMQENPDIDVSGTYIQEFGHDMKYSKLVTYPTSHNDILDFFKKRVPIAHVTAIFRKSFFEKAGFYEKDGHINNGDTLMWMKGFNSNCRFANIPIIGVRVRVSKNFFKRRSGLNKIWNDFLNRLEVNKSLKFGITSYLYAFGIFVISFAPYRIKKFLYRHLR